MKTITRDEWSRQYAFCFGCGRSSFQFPTPKLETHEMARGPHRAKALKEPATWLRLCPLCHAEKFDSMPIGKQMAYKKLYDPEHYDRVAVNRCRCRADESVTEAEVDYYLKEIAP